MEWLWACIVIVSLAAVMGALALVARRVRRPGTAGQALAAAMAAFDEGFHSTARDAFVEMKSQDKRGHQTPSPGPPRRGSYARKDLP